MPSYNITADRITISELDVRLLVALLKTRNVAYDTARIAEQDGGGAKIYNANAYKALAKLAAHGLVEAIVASHPKDARQKQLYHVTDLGREALTTRLGQYERLLKVAAERGLKP